jgi:hypothetical protein
MTRTWRPFRSITVGCRFGSHRRNARFLFIPTDCGFQPVIGFFPQIAHSRAIA